MLLSLTLGLTLAVGMPSPMGHHDGRLSIGPDLVAALRDGPSTLRWTNVALGDTDHATLVLERFQVSTDKTRFVVGHAQRPMNIEPPVLLRGTIEGATDSSVYLAISERGALGLIDRGDGRGLMALGPTDGRTGLVANGLRWQAVPTAGMPPLGVPVCAMHDVGQPRSAGDPPPNLSRRLLLELAIETDYEFAALFEHDLEAAMQYVVALHGAIASMYQRDVNTDMQLAWVRVWDVPDELYDDEDPLGPFREHWNANMTDVQRDLAQLMSGRVNLPYGGVAWLNAVCGDSGYSVAGYLLGSFVSATESAFGNWDITVAAHELGHNCGSSHTHSYDIDACASGETQRGTIMSYCHTTTGGGANIDMRFHTTCVDAMRSHLTERPCLFDDCNGNEVDDALDIADGTAVDTNGDGIPDACQDCNANGVLDEADIADATSIDIDGDSMPDECQDDCNGNGLPDSWDLALGTSTDAHGDGVPDECDADCDSDGVSDYNQIQLDMDLDRNRNAVLDACEDCDENGTPDLTQLGGGLNIWVLSDTDRRVTAMHPLTGVPMVATDFDVVDVPTHVAISLDGRVLLADAAVNRIVEIDSQTGELLDNFTPAGDTNLDGPRSIVFVDSRVLVSNSGSGTVQQYDLASGDFIGTLIEEGVMGTPNAMVITTEGDLLVATMDGAIKRFDISSGALLQDLVTPSPLGFTGGNGLLVHPDGFVLVSDSTSNGLLAFDAATGASLGQWNTGGLAAGYWELLNPGTLRMGPGGHVLVATTDSNTAVQRYNRVTGLFQRSFYILGQLSPSTTSFDTMPASDEDCNGNMLIDACEIANGTLPDDNSNGIPDGCECIADLSGDGFVGVDDILILIASWSGPGGDVNGDGTTNVIDMLMLLEQWGPC